MWRRKSHRALQSVLITLLKGVYVARSYSSVPSTAEEELIKQIISSFNIRRVNFLHLFPLYFFLLPPSE